jgi:MFS family permease
MTAKRRLTPWMIGVGVVTFLAGLLFGYDQGVISGALPLLVQDLDLSTFESEIITSWVTLGTLFGVLVAGGLVGMTVSLAAVGLSFAALENQAEGATSTTVGGIVTVIALVVFIASFAFSMGPTVWTLISEIYPNRVRGRAISVATAVNWLSAFLVAQFFLSVVDAIGESTTFFLFSALCIVSFVFVWRLVPETKGRSLEEIQERWVLGGDKMLDEEAA